MLKTVIPFVDLRGKTPVDLVRSYPDKARELISASRRIMGMASYVVSAALLPLADRRSYAWLARNKNPYLHEIESMAEIVKSKGLCSFNLSYEWGCTSGVYRTEDSVSLLRVLDWPFPQLGKNVVVTLQQGQAGEFYNITWPGISGVFNAMAPGKFAVALNMAPMRKHHLGFAGDWFKNRTIAAAEYGLPPSHLIRQVCEKAGSYEEAKAMLAQTPIAVPVIFILSGIKAGQGCIIERLENTAEIIEISADLRVNTANHFNTAFTRLGKGWRPREIDSPGRYKQANTLAGHHLEAADFAWLRAPIINQFTRICVIANAATGRLMLQGYEGTLPVTELFHLPGKKLAPSERQDDGVTWS